MHIAEQQMIAAAVGMQARGWTPFASTFAAFLSRAYDFVPMAAIFRADLRLSGSHAGVSIGPNGPPRWRWKKSQPYGPSTARSEERRVGKECA